MTTNLLCTILLTFSTNTVEHWPQKIVPMPRPAQRWWNGYELLYVTNNGFWTPDSFHSVDDTNSDTKSIETTVTAQRLLSFEFEGKHTVTLTNWTEAHYQVDWRRVRTNDWFDAVGATNGFLADSYYVPSDSISMRFVKPYPSWPQFLIPTNHFVPVKTNVIAEAVHGFTNLSFTAMAFFTNDARMVTNNDVKLGTK